MCSYRKKFRRIYVKLFVIDMMPYGDLGGGHPDPGPLVPLPGRLADADRRHHHLLHPAICRARLLADLGQDGSGQVRLGVPGPAWTGIRFWLGDRLYFLIMSVKHHIPLMFQYHGTEPAPTGAMFGLGLLVKVH